MPNQDPHLAKQLLSHQAFLRRLAIDLVGKDADDLVQDVWQRALERRPRHGRQLRSWLARIARNLAADHWRGEARRRAREERRANEHDAGDDVEARFELRKELVAALDSLNPSSRETILLRYFDGLAPTHIAERQGVPLATVKTRLRRGLGQLRRALDLRHGDDRATWMRSVTVIAAPGGSGISTGTKVMGWMAMATKVKVSAAVLVTAACSYLVMRTPEADSPRETVVGPPATDVVGGAPSPGAVATTHVAVQGIPFAGEPPVGVSAVAGMNVLRVVLEGVSAADARMATVTLNGVDARRKKWPADITESWPCQGLTSVFDVDPFLVRVERNDDLRVDELRVDVDHPHYVRGTTRVSPSQGQETTTGKILHEVRVRLARPEFWPDFTLAVRDARTGAHLEDVELRFVPGSLMSMWGLRDVDASLGGGLKSPIVMMGWRDPEAAEPMIEGLALRPPGGDSPRPVEMLVRQSIRNGVRLSAWSPGYAWGTIGLDVSEGDHQRQILLEPGATLDVRLTNVQLDRYAALETEPVLGVYRIRKDGGDQWIRFDLVDEKLASEGLRIKGLALGEYAVAVELGEGEFMRRPVLARERITLAAGETGLVMSLSDAPEIPVHATLGGVVSFPAFGGEKDVELKLYAVGGDSWGNAVAKLSLSDLERVDGARPTWSFSIEDLPVGLYQAKIEPFQKSWMIQLPPGGRENVELVIPQFAEVVVETVDARTGRLIGAADLKYGSRLVLPNQVDTRFSWAHPETTGRFRILTAPGPAFLQTNRTPEGYGWRRKAVDLIPGLQTVRFEIGPAYLIRFEFRVDGATLRGPEGLAGWVRYEGAKAFRAVGHEGRALGTVSKQVMEVTAPGTYEINFEGLGTDHYHPVPSRFVHVREGQLAEVIVELRRK